MTTSSKSGNPSVDHTTDMRECVASVLHESFGYETTHSGTLYSEWTYQTADSAIAAATPFIRAALYDELIALESEWDGQVWFDAGTSDEAHSSSVTLFEWLQSRKESNQ